MIPENSTFAVHFIDVGQGDAALVLCDGKSMLIDGGKPKSSDVIYTYLKNQGINCLDYIICTHPDEDHIGGLSAPLSTITVNNVYAPNIEADTKSYQSFKQKTEEQGLIIKHPVCGESFQFGRSTVNFFGPVTESEDDKNNSSIVMKIIYGETSFLFTGDAEREEEQQILDKGYDLSATVLKVGHHGSRNSTTYPFLREIMPEYAYFRRQRQYLRTPYGGRVEPAWGRRSKSLQDGYSRRYNCCKRRSYRNYNTNQKCGR